MAVLARNVIQRHPDTGQVHVLSAGDEVPDWATVDNPRALQSEGDAGDDGAPDEGSDDELQDILGELADDDLESKNVDDLKDLLRERDLPVSGTKDELVERLREA